MNILIKNISILTCGQAEISNCNVCIKNDTILSIGTIPEDFIADTVIDGSGKLLTPGLVNAHTHSYMTVFKNAADDLSFSDWLFGRISPMEDQLTAEDCYYTSLLGCMEMISGGVTSFLDMHMFPHATAKAVDYSGIRAVLSRGLVGGIADTDGSDRRMREAFEEINAFKNHPRLGFMLAPHAPYTCDSAYLEYVAKTAKDNGLGIHTHLSESISEMDTIKNNYSCSPVELFLKTGVLENPTVAAHCVHISDSDIEIFKEKSVTVAANPTSNLKLANGIAPIGTLLSKGINVALGTDGSASNNALSILREMNLTALLHKGTSGDPTMVSAADTFKMATANGAAALGINAGKIEVGALADLVIFDLNSPSMRPVNNLTAALSYSAGRHDVETVIISGEIIYENHRFTKIDTEKVYAEVDAICRRIGTKM